MKNKALIYAIIVILGIGLLWFADVSRDKRSVSTDGTGNENIASGSISGGDVSPTPSESEYPEIANKYPPAECSLAGNIKYLEPGTYENLEANINYKNIDSKARHIIWTISPKDDLSVGPNLFSRLFLPDGTEDVTIGLPDYPKSKNYTLTAKVTYGRFVKGNLEIKEASCSGQIPVEISY